MYCPRCGEQQASGNLKFCPKCGLPMGLVSQILSNNGTLPQLDELLKKGKRRFLTRRNGMVFSLFWFLFFVLIVTPFWAILEVEEMAAIGGVTGVFGALIIFLSSLFFLGKPAKHDLDHAFSAVPHSLSSQYQGQQQALPPQMGQSAAEYASPEPGSWRAPETGDLAQPGSVTEGTTRLLKKEKEMEDK